MGLTAKRSELERQLEQLTDRRQELYSQRQRMGRLEGQGLDNRIALIDEQTTQIEREILQLNSAIAQGTASVTASDPALAQTLQPSSRDMTREIRSSVEDAVAETLLGGAAAFLAMYVVWRGFRRWVWKKKPAPAAMPAVPDHSPRLEQLQQSMDVIALEVERISEAQRYLAKVMTERGAALGAGDAQGVPVKSKEAIGDRR